MSTIVSVGRKRGGNNNEDNSSSRSSDQSKRELYSPTSEEHNLDDFDDDENSCEQSLTNRERGQDNNDEPLLLADIYNKHQPLGDDVNAVEPELRQRGHKSPKKKKNKKSKELLLEAQNEVLDMADIINESGMKRVESCEILHLTLHQCARDGNIDLMERLISSISSIKRKINKHDEEGLSPLHYAARYNHFHIVKMLHENGADVNNVDKEGATPLHFASRYKRMRIKVEDKEYDEDETDEFVPIVDYESTISNSVILYLVKVGQADVNIADIYGSTPLHFASMRGNEIACKELLNCRRIQIETEDKQGMRALHVAASHNEHEIVAMLLEQNATIDCYDEEQSTPLHYACMEGNLTITKQLFDAATDSHGWTLIDKLLTALDNQKNTALHIAVENHSIEIAELLIDRGASVNVASGTYSTPLHLAAIAGDVDIIGLLIDHEARLDILDINQMSPLHRAAAHNKKEAVQFLLERGAKIDLHDKDNFSPLLLAACNGHAETIECLLSKGANIMHMDKNDKSALYWAAEEEHLEALKVLLSNKKHLQELISSTDRYENSPLHIACQNGFLPGVKELLKSGMKIDAKNEEEETPLHLAAKNGKTKVVRELVKYDYIINDEDEDSNTPLHHAALCGFAKTVKALIEANANVEARNCQLWTPLDCAAAKGFSKTVRVLLEADAPIDPMDRTKTTPLHLASRNGHTSVVTLLLEFSANISQRDSNDYNCLDMAIEGGHQTVCVAIINSTNWKEALKNETINEKTGYRDTPMRKLIRKMPVVAELVFNRCTTSNTNNNDDPKYTLTFDYELLDDVYMDWKMTPSETTSYITNDIYADDQTVHRFIKPYSSDSKVLKKNHPLMVMVNYHQEDLLVHPLVTSLLRHKWASFGRYVYYTNLLIYCIFLTFLTGYAVSTKPPYMYTNTTDHSCERLNSIYKEVHGTDVKQPTFAYIGKYVIMVLAAVNLLREIFQFLNAKWNYFGWENLMEWITYVSALLLVIDFNSCQERTGIRSDWQWQLAALAVFLGWMDLVLFIRKLPRFGIYVVMFTDVLRTFAQFSPVFFLFIVAFGLAFFLLMQNQYAFRRPQFSMLKTAVMMIGEFEFSSVYYGIGELDTSTASQEDIHGVKLYYQGMSYTLFVAFLVLMAIIVTNLLVGLAVDDIKAVQEQAILKRLAMQVELALDVESIVPQFIRRRFIVKQRILKPNINRHKSALFRWFFSESSLSSDAIAKALDPELDDIEKVQESQEKLIVQMDHMRLKMKTLSNQNQRLDEMLSALCKAQGIDISEEDFN